jgi:glycosyltransferase involved in cell wall biosynthesis
MPSLSLVTHFYNHPERVQDQLAYWATLPAKILSRVEFVVVDDGSRQRPVVNASGLDLRLFRINSDIAWNQSGARNLGAFHANGDWAIFFDIDQKLHADPIRRILEHLYKLDDMTMYYLRSDNATDANIGTMLPFHLNTFLVKLRNFRTYGMFDEDFAGHYGFEDLYMSHRWERSGGKRAVLEDFNYFEDLGFGTTTLDRDLSRNKLLQEQKLRDGCRNAPGILRFEWEQVRIGKR